MCPRWLGASASYNTCYIRQNTFIDARRSRSRAKHWTSNSTLHHDPLSRASHTPRTIHKILRKTAVLHTLRGMRRISPNTSFRLLARPHSAAKPTRRHGDKSCSARVYEVLSIAVWVLPHSLPGLSCRRTRTRGAAVTICADSKAHDNGRFASSGGRVWGKAGHPSCGTRTR